MLSMPFKLTSEVEQREVDCRENGGNRHVLSPLNLKEGKAFKFSGK